MASSKPTTVTLTNVRFSYVHLFQPYANQPGQEAKYSCTVLVPKNGNGKQLMDGAVGAAIQDGIANRWNGIQPPKMDVCVHDGDGVRPSDGLPFGEECRGHWVFTASSKQRPSVVDRNVQPIFEESQVYSGIYGNVNVNFFAYNANGKKGIGCGLNHVQKIADGEPLGNRMSAEEAFGGAAVNPYPTPVAAPPSYTPASAYPQTAYPQPVYPQNPVVQPTFDPITGQWQ